MPADPPADAVPLDDLVRELGPLPGPLAAGYARQAADLLRAAHEWGRVHGDIRPGTVLVGPVISKPGPDGTPRRKPSPGAAVTLAEAVPGGATPADDLRGLGATLYFLLAARPPAGKPAPIAALRPDLPPDFAALVHQLLDAGPITAAEATDALAPFAGPPAPALPVAEAAPGWSADPFPSSADAPGRPAPRRPRTAGEKARIWLLIALGLGLNLAAVALAAAWWTGALDPKPEPQPDPAPATTPKKPDRPARGKKAQPERPEADPGLDDPIRD